jgi:MFS family permease
MHGITARPVSRGLLINRDFALLWLGGALSVLGDFIFEITLVVWIATELAAGQPWAPLAVSGVLIASAIPVFLVGPLAGVFVDRWDPRNTVSRANGLSALLVLALLPATGFAPLPFLPGGHLPVPWRLGSIYVVVFLASACAQFFRPASSVLLRDIVPEGQLPRAASLSQASASAAMLIGPPLAPPLLIAFGPQWALLINACTFIASLLTVLAIRTPRVERAASPESASRFLGELAAGLRFFLGSRALRTVGISLTTLMLGAGALNTLEVFFITENLGAPVQYVGMVGAAQGAGMVIGAVLAGFLAHRVGLERMLWGALLAVGMLTLVYARLTSPGPALAVVFVIGLVIPGIEVSIGPIVMRSTPREFVGRVSATLNPLGNAASIVGVLVGGALYGTVLRGFEATALGVRFGPLDTIFAGAGVLCVLAGLYAMANARPG